jgi:hypothetical protein
MDNLKRSTNSGQSSANSSSQLHNHRFSQHCTTHSLRAVQTAFQGFLHGIRRKKRAKQTETAFHANCRTLAVGLCCFRASNSFFALKSKLKVITPDAAGYRANYDLLLRNNFSDQKSELECLLAHSIFNEMCRIERRKLICSRPAFLVIGHGLSEGKNFT